MVARLSLGKDATLLLTFSAERRNTARDSSAQLQFETLTLTLRRAAATSFASDIASSCPLHCPGTNRNRVQTRSKVRKRILSPQTMSHRGNQRYSGTVFSSVPYLILVILQKTNAWHQLKSSAGDWAFSMADRMRITGHSFKNLLCILTRSLDACSGLLVGWNVGLSLKALRRHPKLRVSHCSNQSFAFVSPISTQESSKPCRHNHQSWMAHQTALQLGMQGNTTICPTEGLPSTYTVQGTQCCSMCSSSRLLWMCLLNSVSSGLGKTFSGMSASRLREYSSLVVSKVNGQVTSDVTSIFCHSVTCLGTCNLHLAVPCRLHPRNP